MVIARKVIIDCDPGIDDALALCLALFDPQLEVVAITATGGQISAKQATTNVQTIVEQFDPPRLPRLGAAAEPPTSAGVDGQHLHGGDGLGGAGFPTSNLHRQHPSEKIICDEVNVAPDDVTVIALGPLTNIARAFQRDVDLAMRVNRVVMLGGSLNGVGDVTPAAEFNVYYDPPSARAVFRSRATKTLIPLDVTRQVALTLNHLEELPDESTRVGEFLHRVLPYAFRAYHRHMAQESIFVHGAVAVLAVTHPELFETDELGGDVETRGEITTGATIFDRRPNHELRREIEVATDIQAAAAVDALVRGLQRAVA